MRDTRVIRVIRAIRVYHEGSYYVNNDHRRVIRVVRVIRIIRLIRVIRVIRVIRIIRVIRVIRVIIRMNINIHERCQLHSPEGLLP